MLTQSDLQDYGFLYKDYILGMSYKKIWHLLIDKDIKKEDLCKKVNASGTSLVKMVCGIGYCL